MVASTMVPVVISPWRRKSGQTAKKSASKCHPKLAYDEQLGSYCCKQTWQTAVRLAALVIERGLQILLPCNTVLDKQHQEDPRSVSGITILQ